MAPVLALSGHVLFTRRWNVIRDMRWLLVPFLVALALVPMCIGLYEQYGMHGLRFYFWEQSFGRITGENRWKDDSTALFFTHEVIWQLLPWTLFVLVGIWDTLRSMLRGERLPEYVSISGIVLVFIALSLSHFKLPHYLYVIVPLFSVLAARAWPSEPARWQRYVQMGLVTLLALAAFWLAWFAFPSNGRWWVLALVLVPAFIAVYQRVQKNGVTLFQVSFFLMMGVGLVMNASIYPSILSYQANARVGKWAAERGLGPERFSCISEGGTSLNFYAGYTVAYIQQASEQPLPVRPGQVIYTNALGLDALTGRGARPVRTTEILNYPVQLLSLEFLDPARRAGVVERKFLLEF